MGGVWRPNVLHGGSGCDKRRHFASLRPRKDMRILDEGSGFDEKRPDALCVSFESDFLSRSEYIYVRASSLSLRLCLCLTDNAQRGSMINDGCTEHSRTYLRSLERGSHFVRSFQNVNDGAKLRADQNKWHRKEAVALYLQWNCLNCDLPL